MSRSKWKGPYIDSILFNLKSKLHYSLFKNQLFEEKKNLKFFKIQSRSSTITPEFVNTVALVYDGKQYKRVYITQNKIGHKFGEFSHSRRRGLIKKKTKPKKLK